MGSSPHTRGAPRAPARIPHLVQDHPRIRGEHRRVRQYASKKAGSSPHTRGALAAHLLHRRQAGIIPAYAGSTKETPRRFTPGGGIIPAYAGSTWTRLRSGSASGDHPRIRGEHDKDQHTQAMIMGSSPHTRGAPTLRPLHGRRAGSSPHTRGAPRTAHRRYSAVRIIPAYAGSTHQRRCLGPDKADHPRIRGEHIRRLSADGRTGGSSPHTRGARGRQSQTRQHARIIPAYAGSTSKSV